MRHVFCMVCGVHFFKLWIPYLNVKNVKRCACYCNNSSCLVYFLEIQYGCFEERLTNFNSVTCEETGFQKHHHHLHHHINIILGLMHLSICPTPNLPTNNMPSSSVTISLSPAISPSSPFLDVAGNTTTRALEASTTPPTKWSYHNLVITKFSSVPIKNK